MGENLPHLIVIEPKQLLFASLPLRHLIPLPELLLVKALAVLAIYALASTLSDSLAEIGLTPLGLAVLCGFLALFIRDFRGLTEEDRSHATPQESALYLLAFGLFGSAAILFAPSDIFIQHGVSVVLTIGAAAFTALAIWDPDTLSKVRWVGRDWTNAQNTAAIWYVLRFLALMTAYELLIQHGSERDWVLGFALLPVVLYYVMWLGILVTAPRESR